MEGIGMRVYTYIEAFEVDKLVECTVLLKCTVLVYDR